MNLLTDPSQAPPALHGRPRLSLACAALAFLALVVSAPALAQSKGLLVDLEHTAAAKQARETALVQQRQTIQAHIQPGVPVAPNRIDAQAREAYTSKTTFREWYQGLTSPSKTWLREFLKNVSPAGYTDFDAFLAANGDRALAAISQGRAPRRVSVGAAPARALTLPTGARAPSTSAVAPAPAPIPPPQGNKPYISSDESKLVAVRTFDGAYRYHITTQNQSIFLRGSNSAAAYPNYFNDQALCDQCCGPAAAQSVLEWFNVPVKWSDGTPATGNGVQKRLANLMETQEGIDYTDPDDLDRVLQMDEFRAGKSYCYQDGGATEIQLRKMLAQGVPVILLWTHDRYAHYVTVYGYSAGSDKYNLANSPEGDLDSWELRRRWSFDAGDDDVNIVTAAAGGRPYSLWAYAECDAPWAYRFPLDITFTTPGGTIPEIYYDTFSSLYVGDGPSPPALNFRLEQTWDFFPSFKAWANVSSGEEVVSLNPANTKIIARTSPAPGLLVNLSAGQPVPITVEVDKAFLDEYPDLWCGFRFFGVNGVMTTLSEGPCPRLASGTASNGTTYQFKNQIPFDPTKQRWVAFGIHGRFRAVTWTLGGCLRDADADGACDEADDDDDNDGILDLADNCTLIRNPNQLDIDQNGIGYVCDRCEQCRYRTIPAEIQRRAREADRHRRTLALSPGAAIPNATVQDLCDCKDVCYNRLCYMAEYSHPLLDDRDMAVFVDFVHSKWWAQLFGSATPAVPGAKPLPGAIAHVPALAKDTSALLGFESRGIDAAQAEAIVSGWLRLK